MKHKLVKCMLPYCSSYTYGGGKGLCPNHYREAARMVKSGVTTWKDLAEAGLAKGYRSF